MSNINNAIYGGVIGDMVGSVYEWHPIKSETYTFPLWHGEASPKARGSRFTDDTVCGLAIADALFKVQNFRNSNSIKDAFIDSLKDLCPKYEWVGYGGNFWNWVANPKDRQPYQSWGNGSAMRVFPIGLMLDASAFASRAGESNMDLKFVSYFLTVTRRLARLSAEITHDHPEGVKGAESVASAMFLARHKDMLGTTNIKQYIKEYIEQEFGYNLHRSLDSIRKDYRFDVSCQGSVPESIICFLEGNSFEECIRLSVSLGGDADTMGCITGGMASCLYPIPDDMLTQARARLDD